MKYLMVDKNNNIVYSAELANNVGISGAKTYFIKSKRIDEKEFNKLWRVMTEEAYNRQMEVNLRNSLSGRQIEWWEEEKQITDDELKW